MRRACDFATVAPWPRRPHGRSDLRRGRRPREAEAVELVDDVRRPVGGRRHKRGERVLDPPREIVVRRARHRRRRRAAAAVFLPARAAPPLPPRRLPRPREDTAAAEAAPAAAAPSAAEAAAADKAAKKARLEIEMRCHIRILYLTHQ